METYRASDEDGAGPVRAELGVRGVGGRCDIGHGASARDPGVRLAREAGGAAGDTLVEALARAGDRERSAGEKHVDEECGGEHVENGQRRRGCVGSSGAVKLGRDQAEDPRASRGRTLYALGRI